MGTAVTPRWSGSAVVVSVLALAACSSSGDADPTTTRATAPAATTATSATTGSVPMTTAGSTTTVALSPTTTLVPPDPVFRRRLVVTGPEEVVFDWTTDRCEPAHIPDIAPRAFRDASGTTHLTIGHWNTYRMSGPNLDELASDCRAPILVSDDDPDPAMFDDSEWIGSPYTEDGETVYAIVHNEYRGDTHGESRPDQCPSGRRLPCLDTSFTMQISTDGGTTFDDIVEPPGHLVATLPYTYRDDTIPTGIRQPSNLIEGPGGFVYLFGNVSDHPREEQWVCAMRTDDLADPRSWRYWDGEDFAGVWKNPYVEEVDELADKCAPLDFPSLSGGVQEGIVFDEAMQRYVMVGVTNEPDEPGERFGVYYATSEDLIEWSPRELLLEVPINATVDDPDNDTTHAYPSVIDTDSPSLNYSTTDGRMHLYMTRFNFGGLSLDRDLLRWPIEVVEELVTPPDFTFDTDGESDGWRPASDVTFPVAEDGSLVFESVGPDPHIERPGIAVPAGYSQLAIRMRLPDGVAEFGQVFWTREDDPAWSESKSMLFDVRGDGELRDYVLDLSTQGQWRGTITALRIDPLESSDRRIEIDRIWFPSS